MPVPANVGHSEEPLYAVVAPGESSTGTAHILGSAEVDQGEGQEPLDRDRGTPTKPSARLRIGDLPRPPPPPTAPAIRGQPGGRTVVLGLVGIVLEAGVASPSHVRPSSTGDDDGHLTEALTELAEVAGITGTSSLSMARPFWPRGSSGACTDGQVESLGGRGIMGVVPPRPLRFSTAILKSWPCSPSRSWRFVLGRITHLALVPDRRSSQPFRSRTPRSRGP
jgi:hypothetical protein